MYQLLLSALCIVAVTGARESSKCRETVYASALQDTCGEQMRLTAPDSFHITFGSNYGEFVAQCERQRAPVWVDRIYNLVLNGYYNNNYFFRVIEDFVVQFGTNGDPSISNVYNFNSPDLGTCGILEPQPPFMSINEGIRGLSNVFGTVSMSTSYNEMTETTWNATAELFINLGNNSNLDAMLFVPVCTISPIDMHQTVLKFPSFGEVQELGGPGPSIDSLYAEGNAYIEANPEWDTMGITSAVSLSCAVSDQRKVFSHSCGPCVNHSPATGSVPYAEYVTSDNMWHCPSDMNVDTCASVIA